MLLIALNLRVVKFATDETLGVEDRVLRIRVVVVLSGISDTIARCEYWFCMIVDIILTVSRRR